MCTVATFPYKHAILIGVRLLWQVQATVNAFKFDQSL